MSFDSDTYSCNYYSNQNTEHFQNNSSCLLLVNTEYYPSFKKKNVSIVLAKM